MSSQAQGLLCQYLSEDMSGINLGTLDLPEIEKDLVKIKILITKQTLTERSLSGGTQIFHFLQI